MDTPILEMKNITKEFPGVKALNNVGFQVTEGEIHGLVGENGAGNGVFAENLAAAGETSKQNMAGDTNMIRQTPVNFTDPTRMLGASPALLQGKILRGGMGTGMPSWGAIFTQEQIWDLISYLSSFQFEYQR